MAATNLIIFMLLISMFSTGVLSESGECKDEEAASHCVSKSGALPLKLIAIACILVTSMIGACLPLVTRSFPSIQPDTNIFVIVKAFASGIILATGFMHVLPDSFDMLRSSCLNDNPWHNFPFTGFVAMLSATMTLMVDSIATSLYSRRNKSSEQELDSGLDLDLGLKPSNGIVVKDTEMGVKNGNGMVLHGHSHLHGSKEETGHQQLLRYRVIAMVSHFKSSFFFLINVHILRAVMKEGSRQKKK